MGTTSISACLQNSCPEKSVGMLVMGLQANPMHSRATLYLKLRIYEPTSFTQLPVSLQHFVEHYSWGGSLRSGS